MFGKKPHFLGEKIDIPDITPQNSYATAEGMTMRIVQPNRIVSSTDSFVVEFTNSREVDGMTGEWFKIERLHEDGNWRELTFNRKYEYADEELHIEFSMVGYIVFPDKPMRMTVKPWFYKTDWKKDFRYTVIYSKYDSVRSRKSIMW